MGNSFSTETWRRLCKSSLQLLTLQKATKWALAKLCFHSRAFPRPPVILYSRHREQTLFQLHKWAHPHQEMKTQRQMSLENNRKKKNSGLSIVSLCHNVLFKRLSHPNWTTQDIFRCSSISCIYCCWWVGDDSFGLAHLRGLRACWFWNFSYKLIFVKFLLSIF